MSDGDDKRKADHSGEEMPAKRQRRGFSDIPPQESEEDYDSRPLANEFANLPPPAPYDSAQQSHAAAVALQAMAQIRARLQAVGAQIPATPTPGTAFPSALLGVQAMETIIIDCPKSVVGLVIGRGGETIKQMQDQSGARMQIDQNVPAGEPCKITISGLHHAVQLAKSLVEEKIGSDSHGGYLDVGSPDRPASPVNQRKEVLEIPQPLVGKMIGRGGETIRSLQLKSLCNITIDQNFPDGHPRKMTIVGSHENVENAIKLVRELMDPNGGDGKVMEVEQSLVGRIIGRGGETIRQLQQNSGAKITIDQNFPPGEPRKVTISGRPENVEAATKMIEELLHGGHGGPGKAEEVISIDRNVVGRLIGKGGETIKALQSTSGARIQIDQQNWKVTVSGDAKAVERGKDMVRTVIAGGDPFDTSKSGSWGGDGYGYGGSSQQQWSGYGAGYDPYTYQQQWSAWYGQQGNYGQQGQGGGQYSNQQRRDDEKPPGVDEGEGGGSAPTPAADSQDVSKAWQIHYDDQQRPYYWNSITGASSWEKPADMAS